MMREAWGTSAAEFIWAVGIEDTFIPQGRAGQRRLDEYELMDHYRLWRDDIDRAADLGISALRYGIPWYRVEPKRGAFDWSWTDRVMEHLAVTRGLTPIVDLMHYGTPLWLDNGFVNASYPRRVADYAAAFADRYGSLAGVYTPLNEPAVTAAFCGRTGRWPPYLKGDDGFVKVLLALAEGVACTAEAIRGVRPGAKLVHVEDVGLERPGRDDLSPAAASAQERRLLSLDLIFGAVRADHPSYGWLIQQGATEESLNKLATTAPKWDVLGVNYYPWSSRRLVRRRDGSVRSVADSPAPGMTDVLRMVHRRYGVPLLVTETSSPGSHLERMRWMHETIAAVRQVRGEGVPVLGYTWFPMFTMIEWKYCWSRKGLERHLLHLGLWDVPYRGRSMEREPTPLVETYRRFIGDSASSVGEWIPEMPKFEETGRVA